MNINSNISNITSYIDKSVSQAVKITENLSKNFNLELTNQSSFNNPAKVNFSFSSSYIEPNNNYQIKSFTANYIEEKSVLNEEKARKSYQINENLENKKTENIKSNFINDLESEFNLKHKINIYQTNQNYSQISKINETVQNFKVGHNLINDAINSYKFTENLTKINIPEFEYMHKYNQSFEQYI